VQGDRNFFVIWIVLFVAVAVASFALIFAGPKGAVLAGLMVPCLAFAFRYPYWGLLAFLVYLPLGGTMTYAIAGVFQKVGGRVTYQDSSYALFHLAKDAFYFPALLAIAISPLDWKPLLAKTRPLIVALGILLASSLVTYVLQLSLPGKAWLMGIVGLKVLLGYVPWILCGVYLACDRPSLLWLNRLWVAIVLVCCTLALIQYGLLASGACAGSSQLADPASTRASLQAQCFVGGSVLYNPAKGLIRLPGTFVSPWQWAWFLISSSFVTYGASLLETSRPWRWAAWAAMGTVLGATLVSGQRTALLAVPVIYILLLLLTERRKQWLAVKLGAIAIATAVLVSQWEFFQRQVSAFLARWQYSPPQAFISRQFAWLFEHKLTAFGHGLGSTASAARRLGDIQLIETFYAKVIYEIGIVGFLAFFAVLVTAVVLTFRAWRSLHDPLLRRFGLCLWVFVVFISINPYYYPLMVDPVTIYYWLAVGILLKLPDLDAMQDAEAEPLGMTVGWRFGRLDTRSHSPLAPELAADSLTDSEDDSI